MFKPSSHVIHGGTQDVLGSSQITPKQREVTVKQEGTTEGEREVQHGNEAEIQKYYIFAKKDEKQEVWENHTCSMIFQAKERVRTTSLHCPPTYLESFAEGVAEAVGTENLDRYFLSLGSRNICLAKEGETLV